MTMASRETALEQLARRSGVATSYTANDGASHGARPEALLAVLRALGAEIDGPDDAAAALAALEARIQLCSPVAVAWEGRGEIPIDRRACPGAPSYRLTVDCEGGETIEESGELTGDPIPLPQLPIGYHRARLEAGESAASLLIISAPARTYDPFGPAAEADRDWGLFAPLYAFPRAGAACGDLTDLESLCRLTGERGGRFVGTLPLLAASLETPAVEVSPYAPVSRLFWNELYLDLERLPELAASPEAQKALRATRPAIAELASQSLVDPERLYALRKPVLSALAERFFAAGGDAELERFASEIHPRLEDYADFRAGGDPAARRFHIYAQWALHRQLSEVAAAAAGNSVSLYLDLPVGSHPAGYDCAAERELFAPALACGAPPDMLFSGGQNWGFPPLHPDRIRDRGYGFVREMIANHCRYAGVLRIDHVMWLHRIFCVPDGYAATEGVYVHYPATELWAILCIESHRHRTVIVGEDLGTVPEPVTAEMKARGALGMHLLQFGLGNDPHDAIAEPRRGSIASLGSHDTPTFAAFLADLDIDQRIELGHQSQAAGDAERAERATKKRCLLETLRGRELLGADPSTTQITAAALAALASSPARLLSITLEDLWGETRSQNVPGTTTEVPNWVRKAAHTVDEIAALPAVNQTLAEIDRRRRAPALPMTPRASARMAPDARDDVTAISDDDLYLWNEGNHFQAYELLGAHPVIVDGVAGTRFAVWAPNAETVAVIGDWNGWDRSRHPLAPRQSSGIWEAFIPGALAGDRYKYFIRSWLGPEIEKADPVAFAAEEPPRTASVIADLDHAWADEEWMAGRGERQRHDKPINIYEVHLGSFMRAPSGVPLSYRDLGDRLADRAEELGFTHVELLPIMEHPFYGSWGYQSTGYFAPTSRFGSPADFMYMVDRLHQRGVGVILDWVPSHFPTDGFALSHFDGTHLFEHADPRLGFHPDWQSSIFNYGRDEVRSFLISSALFWLDKFHIDGIRVDAVASMLYRDYSRKEGEWIPNQYGGRENLEAVHFLRRLNEAVYARFPDVQTYAEESTAWPGVSKPTFAGGLGFGFKWDMGWMHDTLRYLARDPVHRRYHQSELTFRMVYAFTENYVLSLSHDEVVHGKGSLLDKMPGDEWQKRANLRLLYGYMYTQPGKKLLFMGGDIGQWAEWNHERSLDWHLLEQPGHAGISRWLGHLGRLYRDRPALHQRDCEPAGFEWIDYSDAESSIMAYLRRGQGDAIALCVHNFTPAPREGYRIGVPRGGQWRQIANSDGGEYGGSGLSGPAELEAEETPWQGRPFSLMVTLPPLATVILEPAGS